MNASSGVLSMFMDNPAVILLVGAMMCIATPRHLASPILLIVTALSGIKLYTLGLGEYGAIMLFDQQLTTVRLDSMSRLFVVVFHIAIALNIIYAWGQKDRAQNFATLGYPAAAIGGVLAGDMITLFVWWELAAITSVFLVWAPGTRATYLSGMRYLSIQVLSGVLLLAGIVLTFRETGSLAFDQIGLRDADGVIKLSALLMFLAIGIKCAFPLLHNWVQDSYPKSTISGTIILSIFTTKLAVYALARGFPGTTELIYIGDSDAHIVKGLVAILLALYSGKTSAEILAINPEEALAPFDLKDHLTPQRSNGLASMIQRIRAIAAAQTA